MKEKVYNKLVRDKIPEIINSTGASCTTRILSNEEYLQMLNAKLCEEVQEYQTDLNIEELADIMEVVYALTQAHGYTIERLEKTRAEKAEKRGAFKEKIFLIKTVEK